MTTYEHRTSAFSLPDLSRDIFLLVIENLDAWDIVRCQKVSRKWRVAFSKEEYLEEVLKKYPKARRSQTAISHKAEDGGTDSKTTFNDIASRYYHLRHGKARNITRYKLQALEQYGHWYPVGQWEYHESQPGGRLYYEGVHTSKLGNKPYLFRPTLWSSDENLVACALLLDEPPQFQETIDKDRVLSILDIETGRSSRVPFSITGKMIRNIVLRNYTLIVEWAEPEPFHDLNDSEKVHRHFASCYDIVLVDGDWEVSFRNEWKMHFLGLPLNSRDRFFSIHNGKHYAVYFWQPNRSMYTGDEDMPIEALFVWDISIHSSYRPSGDPAGRHRPSEACRPHTVARFSFRDLDFYGVRQHANISLMAIHLDSESNNLSIRENICVAGQGYFDPAERLMCTTTTTFPFLGLGAANCRTWDGDLPPYRGHCSMDSVDIEDVQKWFLPVMDIYDRDADVRLSLVETCFTGIMAANKLVLRTKCLGEWSTMNDEVTAEVTAMGRIAGDERWLLGQNSRMDIVVIKF